MRAFVLASLCFLSFAACSSKVPVERIEALSVSRRPLLRPELPVDVEAERQNQLALAKEQLESEKDDPESLIWVGRRLAYLGRYRDAIAIFGDGIAQYPEDPRFLRHRGHRYITTRRFDDAVIDLRRAAELMRGRPDVVEPDGIPNARGIPTSTLQSNVWYHLGLAHSLRHEFEDAAAAYEEGVKVSTNPDTLCAMSQWLHLALRRAALEVGGKERDALEEKARRVLDPISASMELIENQAYHELLLLARGERSPESLLVASDDGTPSATRAYGVAWWYMLNDRRDEGVALLTQLVASPNWAAFGVIAAESDLERMGLTPRSESEDAAESKPIEDEGKGTSPAPTPPSAVNG